MTATDFKTRLSSPYPLTDEQKQSFRDNGFIKLKDVLDPEILAHYEQVITDEVMRRFNPVAERMPNSDSNTYARAFRQITNIWAQCDAACDFVFSARLARIATELMGVNGVRLYHDQALYKIEGGGFTPWHADQYYWPLSTPNTCTVWIPFQETTDDMGPLSFSVGSHKADIGRDLPISDESEQQISTRLKELDFPYSREPFALGEVSYHYGWTFHNAPENQTGTPRKVMTVIYVEDGVRVAEPANANQETDLATWIPGCKPGDLVDSKLNPVLYRGATDSTAPSGTDAQ